jgi:hypothetical protein
LCGGGTAGHVMPNIALLKHLKKHFKNIYYIGSYNGIEKEIISEQKNIKYFGITAVKLIRGLNLKNLTIPIKLIKGYTEAKQILKELNPDIIFSKGGYVSVPVTFAAKALHIPVVAHESDFNLGLANKLILKTCTKMCCSFEETAKTLQTEKRSVLRALNNMEELGLIGGTIFIDNKLCAFTVGERLHPHMQLIHIEKGDTDYEGIFPMINQQYVMHECGDVDLINREEDMGVEGMRKAKRSYQPIKMIEKHLISLKDLTNAKGIWSNDDE